MFSCVKVFDFIDIYLCFIVGVCERERSQPYLTLRITFQGPISHMCVYSAALLSLQHQSGSESEEPLGQILRYNDSSLYEVKLRAWWPVIMMMGFSFFFPHLRAHSQSSQVLSQLKPAKFTFTQSRGKGISLQWRTA